ncbi:hypothetical protein CIW82_15405 [Acetobacter tropicalis]|uniref:HTH tetR-type domain-containing protein n=2 Tax=Acetobacter tropicalis TaxID=104102 RepID=A0A291PK51_9PROT|nr:hypothetical protein CIW82_15405 [Acetobacter tropicalis]
MGPSLMLKNKNERDEAVRTQIVEQARLLFERYGQSKTTMSDIAEAAGMSPAHIYNFFKGKNEIIDAVGDQVFSSFAKKIKKEIDTKKDLFEKIATIFLFIYKHNRDHAFPKDDGLCIKICEGIDGWDFEKKFEGFVLKTVSDIIKQAAEPDISGDKVRNDARTILDCMFFGAVYTEIFRSLSAKEHEQRVRYQLEFIRSALLQRGYVV